MIHAFTDGRDTAPNMGTTYLGDLEAHLEGSTFALLRCMDAISPWTGTSVGTALPGATRPDQCHRRQAPQPSPASRRITTRG